MQSDESPSGEGWAGVAGVGLPMVSLGGAGLLVACWEGLGLAGCARDSGTRRMMLSEMLDTVLWTAGGFFMAIQDFCLASASLDVVGFWKCWWLPVGGCDVGFFGAIELEVGAAALLLTVVDGLLVVAAVGLAGVGLVVVGLVMVGLVVAGFICTFCRLDLILAFHFWTISALGFTPGVAGVADVEDGLVAAELGLLPDVDGFELAALCPPEEVLLVVPCPLEETLPLGTIDAILPSEVPPEDFDIWAAPPEDFSVADTPPEDFCVADTPPEAFCVADTPPEAFCVADTPLEGFVAVDVPVFPPEVTFDVPTPVVCLDPEPEVPFETTPPPAVFPANAPPFPLPMAPDRVPSGAALPSPDPLAAAIMAATEATVWLVALGFIIMAARSCCWAIAACGVEPSSPMEDATFSRYMTVAPSLAVLIDDNRCWNTAFTWPWYAAMAVAVAVCSSTLAVPSVLACLLDPVLVSPAGRLTPLLVLGDAGFKRFLEPGGRPIFLATCPGEEVGFKRAASPPVDEPCKNDNKKTSLQSQQKRKIHFKMPSAQYQPQYVNMLTSVRCSVHFKSMIFKLVIIQNHSLDTHCEITHWRIPEILPNEMLTLFQVMAWCRQAASHYLSQCWPRSMSPFAVFSQYGKVGGDLQKVGGDSSTAKRCGAATPHGGGHGRGGSPCHWWGSGGPPPGNFCKNGSQIQQSGAFWGIILSFIIDFSQALMNKFASIFPQIYRY